MVGADAAGPARRQKSLRSVLKADRACNPESYRIFQNNPILTTSYEGARVLRNAPGCAWTYSVATLADSICIDPYFIVCRTLTRPPAVAVDEFEIDNQKTFLSRRLQASEHFPES